MACFSGPEIVNGLVLHLDAANIKSYPGTGTTWNDLSGNSLNVNLVNGTEFSSGSFVFDGVDDRISRSASELLATSGPVTMHSIFAKSSGTVGTLYRIQFGNESAYSLLIGSSGPYTQWWNLTNGRITHQCNFSFLNNVIYAVTATITPSIDGLTNTSEFYVNGNFIQSITTTDASARRSSSGTLFIGSGTNGAGSPTLLLNGKIYNTMYYNRALSAAEIKQNFEATRSRYGI
jgi:hypothetical protein